MTRLDTNVTVCYPTQRDLRQAPPVTQLIEDQAKTASMTLLGP